MVVAALALYRLYDNRSNFFVHPFFDIPPVRLYGSPSKLWEQGCLFRGCVGQRKRVACPTVKSIFEVEYI